MRKKTMKYNGSTVVQEPSRAYVAADFTFKHGKVREQLSYFHLYYLSQRYGYGKYTGAKT